MPRRTLAAANEVSRSTKLQRSSAERPGHERIVAPRDTWDMQSTAPGPGERRRDNRLMRMRLEVEIATARLAGRLSRLAARGGGTTLPGKLLSAIDPGAVSLLAKRLSLGSVLVSATNGKTTTTAMVAEILRPRLNLAHNRSGANLVSGVASALLEHDDADMGLFEVDEGVLGDIATRIEPNAVCLANLFRDQLDRYGELELIAERWRDASTALPAHTWMVVNADDPLVADLARGRNNVLRFGLDDPTAGRAELPHAADSKYCVVCGTPYEYGVAYVGHLGDYRCPKCGHARPPRDVAARAINSAGLDQVSFELVTPQGDGSVRLPLPGLYNVYNAAAAAGLCLTIGSSLDEIVDGLNRFQAAFGRFERIVVSEKQAIILLIKNPAGANEAIRTLTARGSPQVAVIALNDDIADGRDVSWIWDVDFEALLPALRQLVASGKRASELALRFKYGGFDPERIDVVSDLAGALDRGLELVETGGELVVLPTYTAMLQLRGIAAERGLVRPYWEAA